ncbi:MAG TPA: hypothetical protein VNF73_17350 [Candidatus Saccharimonadales bacterium]|nr:hypothetical protein [Candidatus Saccharimonadales bacterium]
MSLLVHTVPTVAGASLDAGTGCGSVPSAGWFVLGMAPEADDAGADGTAAAEGLALGAAFTAADGATPLGRGRLGADVGAELAPTVNGGSVGAFGGGPHGFVGSGQTAWGAGGATAATAAPTSRSTTPRVTPKATSNRSAWRGDATGGRDLNGSGGGTEGIGAIGGCRGGIVTTVRSGPMSA